MKFKIDNKIFKQYPSLNIGVVVKGITEQQMFGGLAFLLERKMTLGVSDEHLMVRVGPDRHDKALAKEYARPMDLTGKPFKGFVFVDEPGYEKDKDLEMWIEWSVAHARTQKKNKSKKKPVNHAARR